MIYCKLLKLAIRIEYLILNKSQSYSQKFGRIYIVNSECLIRSGKHIRSTVSCILRNSPLPNLLRLDHEYKPPLQTLKISYSILKSGLRA